MLGKSLAACTGMVKFVVQIQLFFFNNNNKWDFSINRFYLFIWSSLLISDLAQGLLLLH